MNHERWIGFDADDTLWHNENIFEKVHERYYALLAKHHDPATIERALFATEGRNLGLYGYGIKGYMLSAIETAIDLTEGKISTAEVREILALGREMMNHPVELLEGAKEALDLLAPSYRLLLITKGDLRDQERKILKSGLADRFSAVEIVSEKDPETYGKLVHKHKIVKTHAWMIGNSPRSDINPAMKIGLNAVYIPHQHTWQLEHEVVVAGSGKLVILPAFRELRGHF